MKKETFEITISGGNKKFMEDFVKLASKHKALLTVRSRRKKKSAVKDKRFTEADGFIPGNPDIDMSGLSEIFSRGNWDAQELRKKAWSRKK